MRYYYLLLVVLFWSCSNEGENDKSWSKSKEKSTAGTLEDNSNTLATEKVNSRQLVLDFNFPEEFSDKTAAVQYNNGQGFQEFLNLKIDKGGKLNSSFARLEHTLYRLIVDSKVIFFYPDVDTIKADVTPKDEVLTLSNCSSFETREIQAYTVFLKSVETNSKSSVMIVDYLKSRPAFYIDYLYGLELVSDYRGNYDFFERLRLEFSDKDKYPYAKESDRYFQTVAPEIALSNPDGLAIKLSDYKGKVVVVDFWASWCAPCRQLNPAMVELNRLYQAQNVEFLGVSLDDSKDAWKRGIADDGLSWPQVSELKKWDGNVSQDYLISSIPSVVIIDKEGRLVTKIVDDESPKQAVDQIKKVLDELLDVKN